MGLLLYAVLILFGIRGMPLNKAAVFCLATAAILTPLGMAALTDLPGYSGLQFRTAILMAGPTFLLSLAMAFGCFGIGVALRRLVPRPKL